MDKEFWKTMRSDLRGDFLAVVVAAVFVGNLLTVGAVGGGAYLYARWQLAELKDSIQRWRDEQAKEEMVRQDERQRSQRPR